MGDRSGEWSAQHSEQEQEDQEEQGQQLEGGLQKAFELDLGGHKYSLRGLLEGKTNGKKISPFEFLYKLDWEPVPCFDFVSLKTTSLLTREIRGRRFHNEFLMYPKENAALENAPCGVSMDEAYRGLRDLACVLGMRRSMLFSPALAHHTYTLLLPPGVLMDEGSHNDKLTYLGFAFVHFLRLPHRPHLRRTFSVSLLIVPIDESGRWREMKELGERRLPELRRIYDSGWTPPAEIPEGGMYSLQGPLRDFLSAVVGQSSSDHCALRSLLVSLLQSVALRAIPPELYSSEKDKLYDLAFRAVSVSRCSGFAGIVGSVGRYQEVLEWAGSAGPKLEVAQGANPMTIRGTLQVADGSSPDLETTLQKWIKQLLGEDFLTYSCVTPVSRMLLQPTRYGYPTFFLLPERFFLTPIAKGWEDDDHTIFNPLGWSLLDGVGLSVLQEMLTVFHHQMEGRLGSAAAREFMESFIGDIEEYFDFDLVPAYKAHFETLKRVVGIDADFQRLREKLEFLEQHKILEKEEDTNHLVLFLTVAGLLIAVIEPQHYLPKWIELLLLAIALIAIMRRRKWTPPLRRFLRKWTPPLRRFLRRTSTSAHSVSSHLFLRLRRSAPG
jgi:hypothetical protein